MCFFHCSPLFCVLGVLVKFYRMGLTFYVKPVSGILSDFSSWVNSKRVKRVYASLATFERCGNDSLTNSYQKVH